MISKEEVTLIIGLIGLEGGFLTPEYYTAMMIVVIVITLDTPLLLKVIFGVRNPLSHTKKADIPFLHARLSVDINQTKAIWNARGNLPHKLN